MKKFNKFITEIIDNTANNYSNYPDEYSKKEYIGMFEHLKKEISDSLNNKDTIGKLEFKKNSEGKTIKNSKGEKIFLIPKIELIYNFDIKDENNIEEEKNILDQKAIEYCENINETLKEFCRENSLNVIIRVINQPVQNLFNFIVVLKGKEEGNRIRIDGGVNFEDFLAAISEIHEILETEVMEYNDEYEI